MLISATGEQLGIVSFDEALNKAQENGLDLVEVAPNATPPVCKILNYGKLKYEAKKKQQISKKKQHIIKIKEIRVRPAIGENDLETKMNLGRKFLRDGCKLKVTIMLRGREMNRAHELSETTIIKISEKLADIAKPETQPELNGNRMSLVYAAT